jgi:hypothetical protein
MWRIILLLLVMPGFSAAADELTICYNYACAEQATVVISGKQLLQVKALFNQAIDAGTERAAIAKAVGLFETFAGQQTPTHNDRGGNFNDDQLDGRMDCIDHSRNTTTYLHLMEERGWLKFHRVLERIKRAPFIVNDHWTARIQEKQGEREFAVDSWFFDNGQPAAIFELDDWLNGASPSEP